jgi:hypothetical protein
MSEPDKVVEAARVYAETGAMSYESMCSGPSLRDMARWIVRHAPIVEAAVEWYGVMGDETVPWGPKTNALIASVRSAQIPPEREQGGQP